MARYRRRMHERYLPASRGERAGLLDEIVARVCQNVNPRASNQGIMSKPEKPWRTAG